MRQSSFDVTPAANTVASRGLTRESDRQDRVGACLVALCAFVCYYQGGSPTLDANLDPSWMQTISHAFASGWQWGRDIVHTYGPLGFLAPNMSWNPGVATSYRVGQMLLCVLWAVMVFGFARGLGMVRQGLMILAMVAWYPLLGIGIGWSVPFILAVALIHRWASSAEQGKPRRAILLATIILLSLLALMKFTGQIMWAIVVGYAVLMAWLRRDGRLAIAFGIGAPLVLATAWLASGQNLAGFAGYVTTSLQMSSGYGAMSLTPAVQIDAWGLVCLALLAVVIYTLCSRTDRFVSLLTAGALAVIAFLGWKAGFVRADGHVAIFFGSATFVALAVLCVPTVVGRLRRTAGWIASAVIFGVGLWISYGLMPYDWRAPDPRAALQLVLNPDESMLANRLQWDAQAVALDLPRTRQRIGAKSVDVLMNEQAIAVLNGFNFRPRPVFQGYAAYSPELTRLNEGRLVDAATAPEFVLTKLQSMDKRFPTGDDPLTVIAALRQYLPVDQEGGYLVMQRTGWPIEPTVAPEAAAWKVSSLGADLVVDQGPKPQVLFFDVRLNAWGKLRSFLLREPSLSMQVKLTDGSEHSYSLVRRLGTAGLLASPFLLGADDYLRWHASISERRVVAMQLRAADPADVGLFDPVFSYAFAPVELPRTNAAALSKELQEQLYPGFNPAPTTVESPRAEIVREADQDVLFVHAPARLTFEPRPGSWIVSGTFGLLDSAVSCAASDGFATVIERVAADGRVERVLERSIDPVRNAAERGPQAFQTGAILIGAGDRIVIRSLAGLAKEANTDCDWTYFGSVGFASVDVGL